GGGPPGTGGRAGRPPVYLVLALPRGRTGGRPARRAGLQQPGRGVVGPDAGGGTVHVRAAPRGGGDEQPDGAAAARAGPGAQGGSDEQDGGGGAAAERDRERAGVAAGQPEGVHAVGGVGGGGSVAGGRGKPVRATMAGVAGSDGGARYGVG